MHIFDRVWKYPRINMKLHEQIIVLLLILGFFGDIGKLINTLNGNELVSQNSALFIPGADAFAKRIISTLLKKGKRGKKPKQSKKPPSEHKKNARPSTSDKHQKGQARKQRDQKRAEERRKKNHKKGRW